MQWRAGPGKSMLCFFFQAEDGIRDLTVTGVQTCALPIYPVGAPRRAASYATRATELLGRLQHRGPDGSGTCQLSRAWLGHTRLAIMDPEHGHQPFVHAGAAWVANAEIFNHSALALRYGSA